MKVEHVIASEKTDVLIARWNCGIRDGDMRLTLCGQEILEVYADGSAMFYKNTLDRLMGEKSEIGME